MLATTFFYISVFKGFPQLQLAMVSDLGIIKSFPIDGQIYETFPNFQLRGNHKQDAQTF